MLLTLSACGSNASLSGEPTNSSGSDVVEVSPITNPSTDPTPAPSASANPVIIPEVVIAPPAEVPAIATPVVTTPAITIPEITIPAITLPVITLPVVTTPEVALPVAVKPEPEVVEAEKGKCKVTLKFMSVWDSGYVVEVFIINTGDTMKEWKVKFDLPSGHSLANLWNAEITAKAKGHFELKNYGYNGYIMKGFALNFGMQVSREKKDDLLKAKAMLLNGLSCNE